MFVERTVPGLSSDGSATPSPGLDELEPAQLAEAGRDDVDAVRGHAAVHPSAAMQEQQGFARLLQHQQQLLPVQGAAVALGICPGL